MSEVVKLKLTKAIVKADAIRVEKGDYLVKNIHNLSLILEARHPGKYEFAAIKKLLYKADSKGLKRTDSKSNLEKVINDLCVVLQTEKEKILIVEEFD